MSVQQSAERIITTGELVDGYLKERGLSEAVARKLAAEASRALRDLPNWEATANARLEMLIRLYRSLTDTGYVRRGAEMVGDLLEEMRLSHQGRRDRLNTQEAGSR